MSPLASLRHNPPKTDLKKKSHEFGRFFNIHDYVMKIVNLTPESRVTESVSHLLPIPDFPSLSINRTGLDEKLNPFFLFSGLSPVGHQ